MFIVRSFDFYIDFRILNGNVDPIVATHIWNRTRGHLVSHNPIRWDTGLLWVAIKAEELHT